MWTIKLAKKIPEISDILISADDNQILKIAKKSGILAPWLRPKSYLYQNSLCRYGDSCFKLV